MDVLDYPLSYCSFYAQGNLIRHLAIHDPEASMAEKEEALKIGEPKGPGEQPDGEEEEVYYMEEEEEEDVDAPPFSGAVTISEQGTVQQTEDGQQVVVFEVIHLHPPGTAQSTTDELQVQPGASNGDATILPTLQEAPEDDDFANAVAEAIGEAVPTPSSPAPSTPARRRGRPRKTPVSTPTNELLKQIKVEEIKEEAVKDVASATRQGRKRKVLEIVEPQQEVQTESPKRGGRPVRSCRMRKDDSQVVSEVPTTSCEELEPSPETEELARREAEQERRRLEQKQKDMEECFGFNEDEEETETILAMPAVPGSQSVNMMEDGTLLVNLPNHTGT
ncbi:uncharacterized protein TNIN_374481 [Trichonephila inaurata madagascariensis]|uniref:Uncharacterized protein n=1 Tax=Trichonephila inaurata madagascariensis TaxID=2747483 RepID=A0A8X7BTZ3_9ARAC|nr:uncharacterized protein TNIN_374481 [Trichonephila inaurata madagascariensis]